MSEEKKSSAETAREERKNRIEKASKTQAVKKEKSANQSKTAKRAKIIVPTVIVVLAIIAGLLYYFGVPQRNLTAVKLDDGTKVSLAEYEYYYKALYNNYVNTAYQYDTYYGEGVGAMYTGGFDYLKTPENQKYTGGDLDAEKYGDEPTWADFFESSTIEQIKQLKAIYSAAIENGYELDEDEKASVDEQIEELRSTAAENNYSLNAYLLNNYSRGLNEKLLRKMLEEYAIIDKFDSEKQEEILNSITADKIQEAYDKDPTTYQLTDVRAFAINSTAASNTDDTDYTDEELEKQTAADKEEKLASAQKFYDEVTLENFKDTAYNYADESEKKSYTEDAATLVEGLTKSESASYFGEDAASWIYESGRAIGDKHLFTTENDNGTVTCYIIVIAKLPYLDESNPVNVRHTLLALKENKTDDDGNIVTDENGSPVQVDKRTIEEAKAEAEELLNKWVADGAKEEDFITLAAEKSEDSGSSDNGGLYEDVTPSSSYVQPFLDWCFADGRKVGDYGIIETDYGVHIMYMSSIAEQKVWQSKIKETLSQDEYNSYFDGIAKDEKYNITVSNWLIKRARNKVEDYAAQTIAAINSAKTTAASK